MTGLVIAIVVVVAVLLGALMALRRNRVELPPKEVLDRVKARERELEAQERSADE
jgi:hypothetical protein